MASYTVTAGTSGTYTLQGIVNGGVGIAFDNDVTTLTSFAQPAVLVTSGEVVTVDQPVDDIAVSDGVTLVLDDPGALAMFGGLIHGVISAVAGVTSGLLGVMSARQSSAIGRFLSFSGPTTLHS